ncbi:MAG: quinol monooxygenase YgiN [Flavobacteriales bacterium]|jgi:quinol monooxygenase YgiN
MLAVHYSFEIIPAKKLLFIESCQELTLLIKKHEGGLGSKLHQQTDTVYIAYAQWSDRSTGKNSTKKMPEEADKWRMQMKEASVKIETLHKLNLGTELLEDLK